jgi:hypothetical protein
MDNNGFNNLNMKYGEIINKIRMSGNEEMEVLIKKLVEEYDK